MGCPLICDLPRGMPDAPSAYTEGMPVRRPATADVSLPLRSVVSGRRGRWCGLLAWILAAACAGAEPNPVRLQHADGCRPTVLGRGTAVEQKAPTALGLYVELTGGGEDAKQALDALEARRRQVKQQLESLGMVQESFRCGSPKVEATASNIGTLRLSDDRPSKHAMIATRPVAARWSLVAHPEGERLIRAAGLVDEIMAVLYEDSPQPPTPALLQGGVGIGSGPLTSDGRPSFFLVAEIDAKTLEELSRQALEKARQQAKRLANAADCRLADTWRIERTDDAATDPDSDDKPMTLFRILIRKLERIGATNADEAYARNLGPITVEVTIEASYTITPDDM